MGSGPNPDFPSQGSAWQHQPSSICCGTPTVGPTRGWFRPDPGLVSLGVTLHPPLRARHQPDSAMAIAPTLPGTRSRPTTPPLPNGPLPGLQ